LVWVGWALTACSTGIGPRSKYCPDRCTPVPQVELLSAPQYRDPLHGGPSFSPDQVWLATCDRHQTNLFVPAGRGNYGFRGPLASRPDVKIKPLDRQLARALGMSRDYLFVELERNCGDCGPADTTIITWLRPVSRLAGRSDEIVDAARKRNSELLDEHRGALAEALGDELPEGGPFAHTVLCFQPQPPGLGVLVVRTIAGRRLNPCSPCLPGMECRPCARLHRLVAAELAVTFDLDPDGRIIGERVSGPHRRN
jgi:hypothetical protein